MAYGPRYNRRTHKSMGKRGKRRRHQRRAEQRQQRQQKGLDMHAGYDSDRDWKPSGTTVLAGSRKACHETVHKVWEHGSLRVWCGDRASVNWTAQRFDLYISAAGLSCRANPPIFMTPGAASVLDYNPRYDDLGDLPHLFIECPDGSTPTLEVEQWSTIADKLLAFTAEEHPFDVVVFCEGGHGRTGTVACVLLYFLGAFDKADKTGQEAVDPVWWLRKRYCQEVVETFEQADYITRMTGMTVGVTPSWEWFLNSKGGGGVDTSGTGWRATTATTAASAAVEPSSTPAAESADTFNKPENTYEEVYVRDNEGLWRLTVNGAGDIIYREKITQPGSAPDGRDVEDVSADAADAADPNYDVNPLTGEVTARDTAREAVYASWLGPDDVNEKARWILAGKPDREAWVQHRANPNRPTEALTEPREDAGESRPWLKWLPAVVRGIKPKPPVQESKTASPLRERVIQNLRTAGCKCPEPLLGYRPNVGPRCRTCDTVAPVRPARTSNNDVECH